MSRRARVVAVVVFALAASGCGGNDGDASGDSSRGWEATTFRASDGVRLDGRLYGGWREAAVLLSHMGREGDSQADWHSLAEAIAEEGYAALTYNRRGVCPRRGRGCSGGVEDYDNHWRDIVGAYRLARDNGASSVVLVGASIGAMASLAAAARSDVEIAAVVEVGGVNGSDPYDFTKADLARIEGLKVFASTEDDAYGGAYAARDWHSWAKEPKRLLLLEGGEHGTDILTAGGPQAERLEEEILAAVDEATR